MLDLGRYDEASTLLARLVSTEPDSGRAWCLFARAHLGADRYVEAVEAANRAASIEPAEEWPHRLASNALMHLGNHAEALRAASESGLSAFLSSTLDGPWGIAAALQLASAESISLHCGLATLGLFDAAIARALPSPKGGRMEVPVGPGLGVDVSEDAIREVLVREL